MRRRPSWVAWSLAATSVASAALAVVIGAGETVASGAVAFAMVFGPPGGLIAARLPRNPVGWLMVLVGVAFGGTALALAWLSAGGGWGAPWAAWWVDRGSAVIVPATFLLVVLLPDGRLPSVRWRPLVATVVAAQLLVIAGWCLVSGSATVGSPSSGSLENPIGVLPETWATAFEALEPVLVVPFVLGLPAVVHRLRVPQERAPAVSILAGVVVFVLMLTVPDLVWPAAAEWFHLAGALILTGSIVAAVLRGRVDHVQVVVSHAVVYSLLTVTLLVAYASLVAASTAVGASEQLTALLTAGVALALLPARSLLQRMLSRAMYGDGSEPQRALRRLSASVATSDDLDGLLQGLAHTVRLSVRARWVVVEFRGSTVLDGRPPTPATPAEVVVLDGGEGDAGSLSVGLAPGRSLRTSERELVHDLAEHGARAARVMCMAADLAAARQTLVASREDERARLRQELHDDLGPILAGLAMQLGSLPALVATDSDLASTRLQRLEAEARTALERTRRISRDLRPPALDELGFIGALVDAGRSLGVRVQVTGDRPALLSAAVEVAAYRIACEAILNARRHAGSEQVDVVLRHEVDGLVLEVSDTGPGMSGTEAGTGLTSMRQRAAELGGTLALCPTPGGGLTVVAVLPDGDSSVAPR